MLKPNMCSAADDDPRVLTVSATRARALLDLLEQPARANAGLRDLFSRKAPWDRLG